MSENFNHLFQAVPGVQAIPGNEEKDEDSEDEDTWSEGSEVSSVCSRDHNSSAKDAGKDVTSWGSNHSIPGLPGNMEVPVKRTPSELPESLHLQMLEVSRILIPHVLVEINS